MSPSRRGFRRTLLSAYLAVAALSSGSAEPETLVEAEDNALVEVPTTQQQQQDGALGVGAGVLGCTGDAEADETTVDESEATLHAVDVGDASSAAHAGAGAAAPRFNISAFNGFKLSNLSAALDARCQAAVADVLDRDASGERPPKLYADPLEGARVAPLNGTDDVRFVYFIGVGNRPHAHLVVSRLIYALYSPTHLFLLHVDIKAAEAAAAACYALQAKHANVRVLGARRLVQWGMFSMVSIGLDAMLSALRAGLAFDYFINLSDADLALRTDVEMRRFFSRPAIRGRSFINVHDGGGRALLEAAAFIDTHTIVECAFERRLVPDESLLQTVAMHSPRHRSTLINHNLRWIDWPHSHGDPNEYWNKLGARQYIGGPRVLNASELRQVLASPYLFARKVDVSVDAEVLQKWDVWMARKLAGEAPNPPQAPIGHSPGDPDLKRRFRAPGLGPLPDGSRRVRRRIARLDFEDGSSCGRASVRGNVGEAVVSIKDCRFRLTGAAAVVAATVSAATLAGHVDPSAAGVEEAIAAAAKALGEPTPWWLKRQAP
ncbi:xylosyltransferase 2 [Chrysochromulina tobinii]|uniref:protein xylosyltransferase n=1 Tax=Chrysochromulina tobinii TaxID=1460289 RepID=A0A0M0JW07_9EUKA|nr:xylosyltransferase 2 [Chrysochromulina tobinii]|eukprot:KOO30866.1 xylosyltransferase 2 [Chrysochromulina sp. CCMP291]